MPNYTPDSIRELWIDEIKAVWDAGWPTIFPDNPTPGLIKWPGVEIESPGAEAYWARMYINHLDHNQMSLGPVGSRLFEVDALVTLDIFGPVGAGLQNQYALGRLMQDRFTGAYADAANSDVLVDKARVRELSVKDGSWEAVSFLGNFTYDEVR